LASFGNSIVRGLHEDLIACRAELDIGEFSPPFSATTFSIDKVAGIENQRPSPCVEVQIAVPKQFSCEVDVQIKEM